MADIDQILAGGGKTNANFDFGNLNKSYWEGRDQYAKNDLRDAFKPTPENPNGVPMKDGQIDIPAVMKTLFQKGDTAGGIGLLAASSGAADRAALGNIDAPALVSPPSISRSVQGQVLPPLNKGGEQKAGLPGQDGQQPTVMAVLAAQGIPNDQLGAASASIARQLGVDPTAPLNLQDPQVRNVLAPAIAQLKRQGIGQVQPDQVAQAATPQIAQAQASPDQVAAQNDPILKRLTFLAGSDNKSVAAAAQTRLKSYLAAKEPTNEMKNATASGMALPAYQERQGDLAAEQAGAVERAKSYVEKYNNINEAGDKAVSEIPKLQLALKQMDDPNYYSGPFNQYNLNAKRLVAALGGDPDRAAPQEIVNKITADSVLNGMGALKGLGPIRVAEMKLLSQASMSPDNSVQAQRFLASMAIRVQERVAKVSDMAQNYNEGVLDNGFDKKIRAEDRKEPLFSPSEIDRFQKIMQGKEKSAAAPPTEFPNAKKAPDGKFYVPDPDRPGKYLRVNQ